MLTALARVAAVVAGCVRQKDDPLPITTGRRGLSPPRTPEALPCFRHYKNLVAFRFRHYINAVEIEFDPAKDADNQNKHGMSLAEAGSMDLSRASVSPDTRFDYGEARFRAYGMIDGRLHMLVFTMRGNMLRAISLRKANRKEVRRYG